MIKYQLPQRFMKYSKCFSYLLPFNANQIKPTLFLIKGSQPIMIKWRDLVNVLIRALKLYCKISFIFRLYPLQNLNLKTAEKNKYFTQIE